MLFLLGGVSSKAKKALPFFCLANRSATGFQEPWGRWASQPAKIIAMQIATAERKEHTVHSGVQFIANKPSQRRHVVLASSLIGTQSEARVTAISLDIVLSCRGHTGIGRRTFHSPVPPST